MSLAQRRKYKDPYALAQAKQRKAANVARQTVLQQERTEALGDPVRGITTPFIESFDDVGGAAAEPFDIITDTSAEGVQIKTADHGILNHFLRSDELAEAIKHSYALTEPVPSKIRDVADPAQEEAERQKHEEGHARATAAIAKIVSLANASSKQKTRANVQRCIESFGRHRTDETLRPRLQPNRGEGEAAPQQEKTPRAGPDTGSSEVQIAILTAKIRVLATAMEQKGCQKDKMNKRNLRVLVHRRQKLLNYLRKEERGGDRWQHLVETLGLTEGTWKGEISL